MKLMTRILYVCCFYLASVVLPSTAYGGVVEVKQDQLFIDGVAQPQLFGAEVQYFRLRGGYGRNVPRQLVIEAWNRALDRMVEAKMNAISFYIPWDFHEYAEGKFDFNGTVDEDGDGNPDYPSRDVVTFLKLIKAHGIQHILVRPGPYINAEWGFLGFGAIPKWFQEKYPESHMVGPTGAPTRLYDYHNADFLRHTELYFRQVYNQVLKPDIGVGKPISFLQLDNETNFQWQSIYNHDYGHGAITRYRLFLTDRYKTIDAVNQAHHRNWLSFNEIDPPRIRGVNVKEDQDWYRFQDENIHLYLEKIRRIWESIGVAEPTVLFTLAESYNALSDGMMPNYRFRNDPGHTGLMTVNLYPKTYETTPSPLLNLPFKSDHDVKAADSANDGYFGSKQEWVMGPEIQAGWWKGINVTDEARQQTYVSTIGHGLKALFVYYFNEGFNWQVEQQVAPQQNQVLYFDSPLDENANPRAHFYELKKIGEKLVAPYGEFLGRAREMTDPVCFLREDEQSAPSSDSSIDALTMNSDWAGGLVGYLMQAGVNPEIMHWGIQTEDDLKACKLIVRQDNGVKNPSRAAALKRLILSGHTVLNFIDSSLADELGLHLGQNVEPAVGSAQLHASEQTFYVRTTPLFNYDLSQAPNCQPLVTSGPATIGATCALGAGHLIQVGAVLYDRFNSDTYATMDDVTPKRIFLESVLKSVQVKPRVQVLGGGDRVVVFGRTDGERIMVTAKSGRLTPTQFQVTLTDVMPAQSYRVRDLFGSLDVVVDGLSLSQAGFAANLVENGSTVFMIEKAAPQR